MSGAGFIQDYEQNDDYHHSRRHLHPCAKCATPTHNMGACARCKVVKYCSRKCQKEDWLEHKSFCAKAAEMGLAFVRKFMQRFYLNSALFPTFHAAILHKFRSERLEFSPETTLKATFVIGMEPADIYDFRNIITSPSFVDSGDPPVGMLQILAFRVSSEPAAMQNRDQYTKIRERLDNDTLLGSLHPIIKWEVIYTKPDVPSELQNYAWTTLSPLMFPNIAAADYPHKITIPSMNVNGNSVTKPRTPESCLEYINTSIRLDYQNRHCARSKMQREDMKALHRIISGENPLLSSVLDPGYMHKIYNEDVYDLIPETKRLRTLMRQNNFFNRPRA